MKALAVHSLASRTIDWVEIDDPRASAGEVLVRAHAVGLDPRWTRQLGGLPDLSSTGVCLLGELLTGRIAALGPGAEGFCEGDPVLLLSLGCSSAFVAAPVDRVHVLSEGADLARIAALADYLLAQSILTDAVPEGGALTIWTASLDHGVGKALAFLAPPYISLVSGAETPTGTVDILIDCDMGRGFAGRLQMLSDFGRILVCGVGEGDPPAFFDTLWTNLDRCPELQVWSLQRYAKDPRRFREIMQTVLAAIEKKGWPSDIATRPLADALETYAQARGQTDQRMAALVFPEDCP